MPSQADASREEVLKRAGIERARGLIAAVGTDAENVYAVLTARVLRPDLFIIGRAESEDPHAKLQRAGADRVISPYQIGAVQIAQTAIRPGGRGFRRARDQLGEPRAGDGGDPDQPAVARWRTSRILDANLRQRFGVIVVAIQRQDRQHGVQPRAGHRHLRRATSWSCSAGRDSLKRLETGGARSAERTRCSTAPAVARSDPRRRSVRRSQAFIVEVGRPPGLGIVLVGDDPASEHLRRATS